MSEKVKLPREVAKAIDMLQLNGWTDYFIVVKSHETDADNQEIRTIRNWIRNNTGSFDDESEKATTLLLQALVNGYEVEMSKEERVAEYITRLRNTRDHSFTPANQQRELNIEISGALQVLEYLDIKIDGVNT